MTATIPAPEMVAGPDTSAPWFDPTPLPPAKRAKAPKAPKPPKSAPIEREPRVSRRGRFSSPHSLPEISLLAVGLFAAYVAVAWWLKYSFHYSIGDSLSRSADAKFMLFSRDAHAAAIGVYWMPLPTFSELPFMAICSPLGHAEFAGPLSTAMWSALTVLVLGRIARDLGVSRRVGFAVSLVYALNPVIIFYAANGMSEAAEFFWTALVLRGLLQYLRHREMGRGPVLTGLALAGLCFSKWEVAPAVPVVAAVVVASNWSALRKRNWHSTLLELLLMVGPAVATVGIWLLYLKLITGSFTSFVTVGKVTQVSGATTSVVAASEGSITGTASFVLHYVVGFGFGLVALVVLLKRPRRENVLILFTTLGFAASLVIATTQKVYVGGTLGNPRYFVPVVVVGAVAVLIALGGSASSGAGSTSRLIPGHTSGSRALAGVMLVVMVACSYESVRLERGKTESVEHENRVFDVLAGKYDLTPGAGDYGLPYEDTAKEIDGLLKPGQFVLLDSSFEEGVALFSNKLKQFVISSDRDFERITAPDGVPTALNWAITSSPTGPLGPASGNDLALQLVEREQGWKKVWSGGVADIWEKDPTFNRGLPKPRTY